MKVGKFIQEYTAVYLTAALENILEEVLTQCLFAYVIIELMALGLGISVSLTHKIHELDEAFAFKFFFSSEISTGILKNDFSRMDSQLGKLSCEFYRFPPCRKSFFSLPLILSNLI